MRTNVPVAPVHTHEGAVAARISPIDELKRTVLACLLWEDTFYESGEAVADRIKRLVPLCKPHEVAALALEAREAQRLRHAPLLLVRELARDSKRFYVAPTLERVIQRADELAEFLALYWADGKKPLAKQVKKGLARALSKFDEYALAKYNRDAAVKLRDVMFLVHAKPQDEAQAALWKRLADDTLAVPDTWEVALSAGADKKATFERLIQEGKLGYMALLRNLRNMQEAGVDVQLVFGALLAGAEKSKALPFRYIAAARAVPAWELGIDAAMQRSMGAMQKMTGATVVLVDVSGSMDDPLSEKSDLRRIDAASALAALVRGIAQECRVFTFSNKLVEVPPRSGMALIAAISNSQEHGGTDMRNALDSLCSVPNLDCDRLIVITDEQSQTKVRGITLERAYMLNVGTSKNGVGYGAWTHIDGFSEAVVQYIQAAEAAGSR